VVSTSKGIEGLDLEPEQHLLLADTAEALAAQALRVAGDDALGQRLAVAARERVREAYTWERSAAVLSEQIERLRTPARA
jgi:glycosyltransferase involved in cell wall biosynthesis